MKILLMTDIPPCKNYTAGLVLDQLCRFLPKGSIACFAIVNPHIVDARLSDDLEWIPVKYYEKPRESWSVFHRKLAFANKFVSLIMETYHEIFTADKITSEVVRFGHAFGADLLWCVLQGQTEIRLALPVAERLGIPLYTQVWDPLYFWMDTHIADRISRIRVLNKFEKTLRNCNGFFAASWAMAEQYHNDYGVRAVPFLPSLDASLAISPAKKIHNGSDLIIGAAGKIYPVEVWNALFKALDSINWKIGNRNVKIRILARDANLIANGKRHFEFLGWRSQGETVKLLSEADALYCPYWFDSYYETVTQLSFPGKLTTYLAAGRPVLFHGPAYASPAKFLKANNAGFACHSLDPSQIIGVLSQITSDKDSYAKVAENGRAVFDKYLTTESLRKNFAEFLEVDESYLRHSEEGKQ